jgi:hypothetical protein
MTTLPEDEGTTARALREVTRTAALEGDTSVGALSADGVLKSR